MLTLGIAGGLDSIYENRYLIHPRNLEGLSHDAAAALVEDGRVLAAIEQERLDRIKHSNRFPLAAIAFCLEQRGVSLRDVDRVAVYMREDYLDERLRSYSTGTERVRDIVGKHLRDAFGEDVRERLVFVEHHRAHAASALWGAGLTDALVVTLDNHGEDQAGVIIDARGGSMDVLHQIPMHASLGNFYLATVVRLGFRVFDEYKVMGLAPYGDPAAFRGLFESCYALLPNGEYTLDRGPLVALDLAGLNRRPGAPIEQAHRDVAAALQESLEAIALHILRHYGAATGHRRLCLAGGVAHNCSMNGKVFYSGLFDSIFVQPAAHDAGTAIGAALLAQPASARPAPETRLEHVYLGRELEGESALRAELERWRDFLEYERVDDVAAHAARLLADGAVIGWVQGRSEFGPRALGNRSILADPRPASHRETINAMVKKREAFRPFAPAVQEEHTGEYFELSGCDATLPFMTVVLNVRPDRRDLLGAVTHVDGTARVQTVSRRTNPRFWSLLQAFGDATGVPILLNTSFNNNVEPIVDSAADAIECFLTTRLHYLVIGDFVARKRPYDEQRLLELTPVLPEYVTLAERTLPTAAGRQVTFTIGKTYDRDFSLAVSPEVYGMIREANGVGPSAVTPDPAARAACAREIEDLWSRRLVRLQPRRAPAA